MDSQIITLANEFKEAFLFVLNDPNESLSKKQVFFLDNQDKLKTYLQGLRQVINAYKSLEQTSVEDDLIVRQSEEIILELENSISNFKQDLLIKENVEIQPPVISDTTVQEETQTVAMSHLLSISGMHYILYAVDNNDLNAQINNLISNSNANINDIALYALSPVQLTVKTIVSVV